MCLFIPDDILKRAGISGQDALIELACSLFDAGKLTLFQARELAGLTTRTEMEAELIKRGLPIMRPTKQDLDEDIRNLNVLLGPPGS